MGSGNLGYSNVSEQTSFNYQTNEELGICEDNELSTSNSAQQENLKTENENARASEGVRNLGQVESLSAATSIIGGIIDALVPQEGDKASVEFNMNIPIHPSKTVFFSLRLTGSAARAAENNVNLKTEIQLGVMGKVSIDAWIVEIEAYLRVAGIGYLESMGSSGAEAFNFLGLGIRESIAQVSEKGAEFLMSGSTRDNLFKTMGTGEYAEAGLGVEASGGIGVSSGDESQSVGASYRNTTGTRYTSQDGSSRANESSVKVQEFGLSGSFSGRPSLGVSGKLQAKEIGSDYSIEGSISGDATFSAEELDAIFLSTTWVSGVVTTFGQLITNGANMFRGSTGQKVGQFAGMIRNVSPSGIVLSHYAHDALQKLGNFNGISIGHKVSVKAGYSNGQFSGGFSLERYSKIEYGDGPRDTIHLLLQNIDPVVSVSF